MELPPVVFEDEVLLAFDKPPGLCVAGGEPGDGPCLMTRVHAALGSRITNVHRLDADASGIVLCVKTKPALDFLSGQFQARTAVSVCHALVAGSPAADEFSVELPLAEDRSRPARMQAVVRGGRPAVTAFRVLERFRGFAWIECRPGTSRPHQIRVHLSASGTPVLNDPLYGSDARLLLSRLKRGYKGREDERPLVDSLALHAGELAVRHPLTREPLVLRAPLTEEIRIALKYLRRFGRARDPAGGSASTERPRSECV